MGNIVCRMLLLLVLLIQLSGCALLVGVAAGGAVGAGAVAYMKGELEQEFNVPVPKLHSATLSALKELKLPIQEDKSDSLVGEISSEFADGKKVRINIKSLSLTTSKIAIRVDILGDEARSKRILETVNKQLGVSSKAQ